jgi:hypothetical protein
MVVTVAGQQMHGVIHRRSSPAPGDADHRVARQCGQIWSGSGGFGVGTIGEPVVRFSGTNSAPHRACTLRVVIEYVLQWVSRSDIERKYQPLTRATGSTLPQRDGLILCKRQHARAGDMRVENDLPITFAHHDVGETRRTSVQSAARVDHLAVAAGFRRWYVSGAGHD